MGIEFCGFSKSARIFYVNKKVLHLVIYLSIHFLNEAEY